MKLQELYQELKDSAKWLSGPNLAASVDRVADRLAAEGLDELADAEARLHEAEEWIDRLTRRPAGAGTRVEAFDHVRVIGKGVQTGDPVASASR